MVGTALSETDIKQALDAMVAAPTAPPRQRGGKPSHPWSDEDDRRIIEMLRAGDSQRKVRKALRRGMCQVQRRIDMLRKAGKL